MPTRDRIALGILAGGQARRLGGADKAMAQLLGQPLLLRTLAALSEGHSQVLVSYNGDNSAVLDGAATVVRDSRTGFPGPLAGIEALLAATTSDWLLTVPVDLLDIPHDLVDRLCAAIENDDPDIGAALRDADGSQPLVALWPVRNARFAVASALDAGFGAVHGVQEQMDFRQADISPRRIGNLNTPADFE